MATASTSPLASAYLENDSQDVGLHQLNATLQALGIEHLTEVSVASASDTMRTMLQRMSMAIQTRSQQQDAITKFRTQLTRTRELTQREKQRFQRETAMIQDTHTQLAAADRQAVQARAKLSQERDRYKKETLLRAQRETKLEVEIKRKTREIAALKQRVTKLLNTRPMALPEIAITAALSPSGVATSAVAEAVSEPRSSSVAVIVAQNTQAREALKAVRAGMQAALIKVGVPNRPGNDHVRVWLKLPFAMVQDILLEEFAMVISLLEEATNQSSEQL